VSNDGTIDDLLAEANATEAPEATSASTPGDDVRRTRSGKPFVHQRDRHRPTKDEQEQRVDLVVFLLSRNISKSKIKVEMRRRWSDMSHRTIEAYLARARARVREMVGTSVANAREESLAFWLSVKTGPDATLRDRMFAQEKLDWINGVRPPLEEQRPVNINFGVGAGGSPVPTKITVISGRAELEQLQRARLELERAKLPLKEVPVEGGT
jgi:hypothetical protein